MSLQRLLLYNNDDSTDAVLLKVTSSNELEINNFMTAGSASGTNRLRLSTTQLDLDGIIFGEHRLLVAAKTASYSVVEADSGKFFTTEGASGAITFTLPAVGTSGLFFSFYNAEDQNMIVASVAGDDMVAFNDVAADSVAFQTTSEKAGSRIDVVSDGTKWMTSVFLAAETVTPTIAT